MSGPCPLTIEDVNNVRDSWQKMSLKEKGCNDMSFEQVQRALALYVQRGGEVSYAYGRNHAAVEAGRLCAMESASLQCFPREVRALVAGGKYWDVDAVNAQPTLLAQVTPLYWWACPHTQIYLAQREDILADVMALRGCTRDEAKREVTGVFFGKSASDSTPFFRDLSKELFRLHDLAWLQPAYAELKKSVIAAKPKLASGKVDVPACKRSLFALILQTEERKVLLATEAALEENGRSTGDTVYIHDGLLTRKLEGETVFPDGLLRTCEKAILAKTGYRVSLAVKPMLQPLRVPDEYVYTAPVATPKSKTGVIDDMYAAEVFRDLEGPNLVRDGRTVYIYNPATGMYSRDEADLREAVTRQAGKLVFNVGSEKKPKWISYGGSVRLTQQLIGKLWDVLPAQDGFMQAHLNSDVGKLLFTDGMYDFESGVLQPFSRDVVFSGRVPRPFPPSFKSADVAFLHKTLFGEPFAVAEEGEAYQHAVMRGVIGDFLWKKLIVLLGPPSSGKGMMVMLLKCALGHSLATTFNGNDLLHRQLTGERTARMRGLERLQAPASPARPR
jgi:hypothetical protein